VVPNITIKKILAGSILQFVDRVSRTLGGKHGRKHWNVGWLQSPPGKRQSPPTIYLKSLYIPQQKISLFIIKLSKIQEHT
jgi:hypothetical protein